MTAHDLTWNTSSYSNDTGGHCVEAAEGPGEVRVRDTRNRASGHLAFPAAEWAAFLRDVRRGEL